MEPPVKKPRRSWTREEETLLLQHYFRARNDASLRSDKGIKSKAWTLIITRIAEDGVVADKGAFVSIIHVVWYVQLTIRLDQWRSKYSRLMSEYDVYKRLCDLSGAGWCSETNAPTLDEEGWATLAQAQPRNAALTNDSELMGLFTRVFVLFWQAILGQQQPMRAPFCNSTPKSNYQTVAASTPLEPPRLAHQ
jgi:hypothetical protein